MNHLPTNARLTTDSALAESPRERDADDERGQAVCAPHSDHCCAQGCENARDNGTGTEAIHQPAAGQAEQCADERGPEIDRGVGHAIDLEVGKEWLRNQAEALGPSRQGGDHGQSGEGEIGPGLVHSV